MSSQHFQAAAPKARRAHCHQQQQRLGLLGMQILRPSFKLTKLEFGMGDPPFNKSLDFDSSGKESTCQKT